MVFPFWCNYSDTEMLNFKHWHFGTEFILVTDGDAQICVNGDIYNVFEKQVIMIQRISNHYTVQTSSDFKKFCLLIQHDEFGKIPVGMDMFRHLTNTGTGSARIVDLDDDYEDTLRIFQLFEANWNKMDVPYNSEFTLSLASLLLAVLCRHCRCEEGIPADERMYKVRDFIDRNFTSDITVSEIARHHFISEDHLIHEFKRVIGSSPGQYIILSRLTYARELLVSTNDALSIVAQKSGFGDVNNFIRNFKKTFGVPPGQFRRHNKNE